MSKGMKTNTFEIRVALIGYVSVGKSTVLNALLGDKYSEVSMRRTTAGVNLFRIVDNEQETKQSRRKNGTRNELDATISPPGSMEWSMLEGTPTRTPESTHEEIRKDNAALRASSSVHEKTFDIVVEDPICEMRKDTQLVIIDVPGINEADSSNKYKQYVTEKWNTFDCVIVVMDAVQGVNTEEQLELLKLVKANNSEKKKVHTIIVGNKVDDPANGEEQELVDEARTKVSEIFGVGCQKEALKCLIDQAKTGDAVERVVTTFLPMSALHAFIYRKAHRLTYEKFGSLGADIVDRFGHEEVGRRWKQYSQKERYDIIHNVVSDPSEYKKRIAGTNFDNFLVLLCHLVGGAEKQTCLISRQLEVELSLLTPTQGVFLADIVHSIYKKSTSLEQDIGKIEGHFWRAYRSLENASFGALQNEPNPSVLLDPFSQLKRYHDIATLLKWDTEVKNAREALEKLVRRQLDLILTKEEEWTFETWLNCVRNPTKKAPCSNCNLGYHNFFTCLFRYQSKDEQPLNWKNLSPPDWIVILSTSLLPSTLVAFVELFGREKLALDERLFCLKVKFDPNAHFNSSCSSIESDRRQLFEALKKKDIDSSAYNALRRVTIPELITDPSHWGHIGYEFCKFRRSYVD